MNLHPSDTEKIERISSRTFGPGIDSASRLGEMFDALYSEKGVLPGVFWPVFLETWSSCDATWECRSELLYWLRSVSREKPPYPYPAEADRAMIDDLPDPTTIYRGCSALRVRGVSWTTDRSVAEGFAHGHRFIRVPDPVVVTAKIPKDAIFCVFTDRSESEVLVDPRRLRAIDVKVYAAAPPTLLRDPRKQKPERK